MKTNTFVVKFSAVIFGEITVMALLFEYGNIVIFSEECFKYFFLGRNEKKNVNRIMNLYHYVQMLLRDALD